MKEWTQEAIARELGVSQATISTDLKVIHQEWSESQFSNLDESREEVLKKLQVVLRDAWQRSQKPAEATRIIQQNGEKKAEQLSAC